jgi:hypothetical protein
MQMLDSKGQNKAEDPSFDAASAGANGGNSPLDDVPF